jgi:hypothetical protein
MARFYGPNFLARKNFRRHLINQSKFFLQYKYHRAIHHAKNAFDDFGTVPKSFNVE